MKCIRIKTEVMVVVKGDTTLEQIVALYHTLSDDEQLNEALYQVLNSHPAIKKLEGDFDITQSFRVVYPKDNL